MDTIPAKENLYSRLNARREVLNNKTNIALVDNVYLVLLSIIMQNEEKLEWFVGRSRNWQNQCWQNVHRCNPIDTDVISV